MSGNVHPWIRQPSQAEANAEFDRTLDWLECGRRQFKGSVSNLSSNTKQGLPQIARESV